MRMATLHSFHTCHTLMFPPLITHIFHAHPTNLSLHSHFPPHSHLPQTAILTISFPQIHFHFSPCVSLVLTLSFPENKFPESVGHQD